MQKAQTRTTFNSSTDLYEMLIKVNTVGEIPNDEKERIFDVYNRYGAAVVA